MKRRLFLVCLSALLIVPFVTAAEGPSLEELQKRFKERFPKLLRLRNAGKIGETFEGFVEPVKKEYLDEKIVPASKDPDAPTIKEFLKEENEDRKLLYKILGERLGQPVEEIATQNAIRNFKKAEPSHYLKVQKEKWVQKKELDLSNIPNR